MSASGFNSPYVDITMSESPLPELSGRSSVSSVSSSSDSDRSRTPATPVTLPADIQTQMQSSLQQLQNNCDDLFRQFNETTLLMEQHQLQMDQQKFNNQLATIKNQEIKTNTQLKDLECQLKWLEPKIKHLEEIAKSGNIEKLQQKLREIPLIPAFLKANTLLIQHHQSMPYRTSSLTQFGHDFSLTFPSSNDQEARRQLLQIQQQLSDIGQQLQRQMIENMPSTPHSLPGLTKFL